MSQAPLVTEPQTLRRFSWTLWKAAVLFAVIWGSGTAVDLLSKHWAFASLGMPGTYTGSPEAAHWIWQDVAGCQTSLNTGALFGMGGGQALLLALLSLLFQAGIIVYLLCGGWKSIFITVMLGMISAGICGNLYDRLGWHGLTYNGEPIYAVRDWILVMIGSYHWPNFNIADSLLVCSVILLLIQTSRSKP